MAENNNEENKKKNEKSIKLRREMNVTIVKDSKSFVEKVIENRNMQKDNIKQEL